MKHALFIIFIITTLMLPAQGHCSVNSFKKGLKDVITAPAEVSDHLMEETKDAEFFPFAFVGGLLKGSFYMGKQIVTGVLEMVSSPLESIKK